MIDIKGKMMACYIHEVFLVKIAHLPLAENYFLESDHLVSYKTMSSSERLGLMLALPSASIITFLIIVVLSGNDFQERFKQVKENNLTVSVQAEHMTKKSKERSICFYLQQSMISDKKRTFLKQQVLQVAGKLRAMVRRISRNVPPCKKKVLALVAPGLIFPVTGNPILL